MRLRRLAALYLVFFLAQPICLSAQTWVPGHFGGPVAAGSEGEAEEKPAERQSSSSSQESPNLIRIGVLAKRGRDKCLAQWEPTAEYLSNEISGHRFEIVPLDFDEIYPTVERGEADSIAVYCPATSEVHGWGQFHN